MKYKQVRLILLGMAYDLLKGQELCQTWFAPLSRVGIIRRLKIDDKTTKLFFVMQK